MHFTVFYDIFNINIGEGKVSNKPVVFVITPFSEDFLALYEELKSYFADEYEFTNAGDLDNQQNILRDIVEGIFKASVVIADLTGLNANVFYELGLAHAMNKKVIIITQEIDSLPFDIKSYRANEYSLKFYKLPSLKKELTKLLKGAIDGSVLYGNPVSDILPKLDNGLDNHLEADAMLAKVNTIEQENADKGFLDYLTEVNDNSAKMNVELMSMVEEITDISDSVTQASYEIDRVKSQSGNLDVSFARGICRKLSSPIDNAAQKLKVHIGNISSYWDIIENSYLAVLDSKFIQNYDNLVELMNSKSGLIGLQGALKESNATFESFVAALRSSLGVERKLNKAILSLIYELEGYLSLTDKMYSSIDRIIAKSDIAIENIKKALQ